MKFFLSSCVFQAAGPLVLAGWDTERSSKAAISIDIGPWKMGKSDVRPTKNTAVVREVKFEE